MKPFASGIRRPAKWCWVLWKGHTDYVFSAVFSPDGRLILSASADKTICIWDSRSGDTVLGPLEGHQIWCAFAVFSADGRHILSCSRDSILVWDSKLEKEFTLPLRVRVLSVIHQLRNCPLHYHTPHSNIPVQGTSALSYLFSWRMEWLAEWWTWSVDRWLYADPASYILIGRYTGQLMLISLWGLGFDTLCTLASAEWQFM